MKNEKKLIGTGILAAIASSLCCITPAVAFLAGVSGIASAFTWIEPIRPFLMLISVFALGFAWYKILKPKKPSCDLCVPEEKPSFFKSVKFLSIISLFAVFSLTFPYYSHIFYPEPNLSYTIQPNTNLSELLLNVGGMRVNCKKLQLTKEPDGVYEPVDKRPYGLKKLAFLMGFLVLFLFTYITLKDLKYRENQQIVIVKDRH